jgi:integrase/recombinase XerD
MTDAKIDRRPLCMRLADWPKRDRMAWQAAVKKAGVLDEPGLAAHWRPATQRTTVSHYGRFLTYLDDRGLLDRADGPQARLTPDRLRGYIDELRPQLSPVTLSGRITGLAEALRVMAPTQNYRYLKLSRRRLKARMRPTRDKRSRMVSSRQLLELGLELIERAETQAFAREVWRACTYRDGITILVLASRPIRRRNLAQMRLGLNLAKRNETYELAFDGASMKNHRSVSYPLAPQLTAFIDRYLDYYRPILLGSRKNDHVWISWRRVAMSEDCLYKMIVQHTRKAFGHPVNPHLFRDIAVTSAASEKPEYAFLSLSLLQHGDHRTAEKHYNQALDGVAVDKFQGNVLAQRHKYASQKTSRLPRSRRQEGGPI